MHSIRIISRVIALVAMVGAAANARAADEIHWTIMGPTAVTVDWRGPESSLQYGFTPAHGQSVVAATPSPLPWSSAGPFWEAQISGLVPDTLYHYSIGGGPDHTFRTARTTHNSNFTIYAEGDVGSTTPYWRMGVVQSLVAQGHPDFTLMVGDLTYANAHGQAVVDQHFNDVMAWSQDAAYMPAWGNHEYENGNYTDDLRNYKGRFGLPNAKGSPGAPAAGNIGEDWYWFDYGNVRFIAYPEPYSGAWANWYPRADSIMDDAQKNPDLNFIVTFGHRPAYSSGHHPGSPTLKSYLDQLGASHSKYKLNLNGHSHNYERTYAQSGVVHITAGGGGGNLEVDNVNGCLYRGGCPPPSWSAFRAFRHGPVKLIFSPDEIKIQAICGPPGDAGSNRNDITCTEGSVFDSVSIRVVGPESHIDTPNGDTAVAVGGVVNFTGTAYDADGDGPLAYHWEFGGGAPDAHVEDPGPVAFNTTGVYLVRFTAVDTSGESDPTPDTRTITVGNVNRAPDGAITSPGGNLTIVQGHSIVFQGLGSDPDGDPSLTYYWDFDEGAPDVVVQNPGPVAFNGVGEFVVRFVVTDSHGLADPAPATVEITVVESNQAPSCDIVSPASDVTVGVGEAVNFQGSAADPDANVPLTYTWNFGGAAPASYVEDPGMVTFSTLGTYSVTFLATDALGLSTAAPATRTVTVAQPNHVPIAALDLLPATGNAPLATSADATGSNDSDGSIVSYQFDFGDGTVSGPVSYPTFGHTYTAGTYTSRVTVTDDRGGTQTTTMPVIVAPVMPGTNFASNASFETNLSGWAAYAGSPAQIVTGGFDFTHAVQVIGPATTATFGINDSPNWVSATSQAGVPYRFSAWVRSRHNTGRGRIQVREFQGSIKIGTTTFSPYVPLTPAWQLVTVDYPVVQAGTTLDMMVLDYPVAPSETLLVDNVSIKVVGATTGVGPLDGVTSFAAMFTPNPLHTQGAITFVLPKPGFARVEVLDLSGRHVRTLLDEREVSAGRQRAVFDGRDAAGTRLASGLYFYRVSTAVGTITQRFAVLR